MTLDDPLLMSLGKLGNGARKLCAPSRRPNLRQSWTGSLGRPVERRPFAGSAYAPQRRVTFSWDAEVIAEAMREDAPPFLIDVTPIDY